MKSKMLLKNFFIVLGSTFVLALLLSTAVAEEAASHGQTSLDEAELLRLEKVWNEAHLRGDADTLDRLWDNDLAVIVPKMKLITKSDALGIFRTGRMKFLRYETSDLSTRVYGDTAIVTGRLLRTRQVNDCELQDDWRFSKVYVRRAGDWRIVLWQASEWPAP